MYEALLFVHSWMRWAIVVGCLYWLVRLVRGVVHGAAWSAADERTSKIVVGLVDLQLVLGALLYFDASILVASAWSDIGAAMKSSVLRFYSVEHVTVMVVAIGVLHAGRMRARWAKTDAARFRTQLRFTGVFVVLIAVAIPWPGLSHGRPLARTSIGGRHEVAMPAVYEKNCVPCHGADGRGRGSAATMMKPSPRDFTDAAWQRDHSDAMLRAVIRQGGAPHDLSPDMPAFGSLEADEVEQLLRQIRAFGGRAQ